MARPASRAKPRLARRPRRRPWFEIVPPDCVIDWDVEDTDLETRGRLKYGVIRDERRKAPGPFQRAVQQKRYRVWTRDIWMIVVTEDGKVVDQRTGPNELGEVPLVPF